MPPPPRVNSTRLAEAMVRLVRAFGLHRPAETPCGQPVGVAEAHALMDLSASGPMSQKELAAGLRLEKSTVSRLIHQMERQGWIRRTGNARDARMVSIHLSKAGRAQAAELARSRRRKFARLLAAIPFAHRARVVAGVAALAAAAENERAH